MVYLTSRSAGAVLDKLSLAQRMGQLSLEFSGGWNERTDRRRGRFNEEWGSPASWDDVILQGSHLFVATPLYKMPNVTMLHQRDWSATDFEALESNFIPITSYKPTGNRYEYDCAYTDWGDSSHPDPARDHYRLAWRRMAANTGERTLIAAMIPPGAAHVNAVMSVGAPGSDTRTIIEIAGFSASLVLDFFVRLAPKGDIYQGVFNRLPIVREHKLLPLLRLRTLRLEAVTDAYAGLWEGAFEEQYQRDSWALRSSTSRGPLGDVHAKWTAQTPLRCGGDRRQALVEIDALVALMLGLTADDLCNLYRTQFPVLFGYDRSRDFYDINGRLVPHSVRQVWRRKGQHINREERTATNKASNSYTYELPFVTLDREADMRTAYAEFERRLAERS